MWREVRPRKAERRARMGGGMVGVDFLQEYKKKQPALDIEQKGCSFLE